MNYQVVKLSNGEDIICKVENLDSGKFKVTSPLKMSTHTKVTERGAVESLGLSRWLQVYSDEPHYIIEKSGVVIMTPASEGLCRYYEYVLKSMDKLEMMKGPTQQELNEIEDEEYDLNDWDIDEEDKIYH
tara:strand:+ start:84 stop:473 length:390 start_codon:yes stop_codon:yes gene_type:complete